jgi:hypothetical protein
VNIHHEKIQDGVIINEEKCTNISEVDRRLINMVWGYLAYLRFHNLLKQNLSKGEEIFLFVLYRESILKKCGI